MVPDQYLPSHMSPVHRCSHQVYTRKKDLSLSAVEFVLKKYGRVHSWVMFWGVTHDGSCFSSSCKLEWYCVICCGRAVPSCWRWWITICSEHCRLYLLTSRVPVSPQGILEVELLRQTASEVALPFYSLWWLAYQPDWIKKAPRDEEVHLPGELFTVDPPWMWASLSSSFWMLKEENGGLCQVPSDDISSIYCFAMSSWPWWDETII